MEEIKLKYGDKELVQMMANSLTRSQMAKELGVQIRALDGRIYRLKGRTGLKTTNKLIIEFYKRGWIS